MNQCWCFSVSQLFLSSGKWHLLDFKRLWDVFFFFFGITANKRTKEAIFNHHAWPNRSNVKNHHCSKGENLRVPKFQGNKYQQHWNLEFFFFFLLKYPFSTHLYGPKQVLNFNPTNSLIILNLIRNNDRNLYFNKRSDPPATRLIWQTDGA